jgi:hypothetical protein
MILSAIMYVYVWKIGVLSDNEEIQHLDDVRLLCSRLAYWPKAGSKVA